jgi:hypothetical protein
MSKQVPIRPEMIVPLLSLRLQKDDACQRLPIVEEVQVPVEF